MSQNTAYIKAWKLKGKLHSVEKRQTSCDQIKVVSFETYSVYVELALYETSSGWNSSSKYFRWHTRDSLLCNDTRKISSLIYIFTIGLRKPLLSIFPWILEALRFEWQNLKLRCGTPERRNEKKKILSWCNKVLNK